MALSQEFTVADEGFGNGIKAEGMGNSVHTDNHTAPIASPDPVIV